MVEQVTPSISQSQLGANGDNVEGAQGETVLLGESDHLIVAWPGAGQAVILEPQPGQPIEFDIDFSSDSLEIIRDADGDLIFRGPDGEIILAGGMTLLESDNPPHIFYGDTEIQVGDLAGLMGVGSLDDIASTGASLQNTGAAFRPPLFGELPPGLEDLGPQPPTELFYRLIEGLFDVTLLHGQDSGPLSQGGGGGGGPEGECDTCCCVDVPELSVVLYGTPGDDLYDGSLDTDTFYGSAGWDLMFGRGASDTVDYSLLDFDGCWGVYVDIGEFFLPFFGWIGEADKGDNGYDLLVSLENVIGTDYNDAIFGNSHPNTLDGQAGHDYLNGRGGDDLLIGGEGNDYIDGGGECEIGDTVSYADDPEGYYGGVLIDLKHGFAIDGWNDYDHLDNIENAIGSQFSDLILGDHGANILNGLGGDDEIYGDKGDDTLIGGDGADMMFGEAGNDTVDYSGDPDLDGDGKGVIVDLRPDPEDYSFDSLTSGNANNGIAVDGWGNIDVVGKLSGTAHRYNDIENVVGSRFDDLISGDYGDNMLVGDFFDVRADGMAVGGYVLPSLEELLAVFDEGEQVLQSEGWYGGFSAPDYVYYGDHDSFTGGNDVIEGEPGDDLLIGDVYEFSANESLQFAQVGACNDCSDSDYVGGDVYFYAGCDVLYGGNDIINGDFFNPAERRDFEGNDTITGDVLIFEGNEQVLTEPYDGDWLYGFGLGTGDVFFTGGNDVLYGGDDQIHGGLGFYDGNDPLDGRSPGDDTIYGDAAWFRGDEQIGAAEYGGIYGDIVFECGNDALYGGDDTIYGGAEYLVAPGKIQHLDTLIGDAGTVDFNELFSASAWCDPREGWTGGNILVKGGDDTFVGGDDTIYGGGLVDEYGGICPQVGTKIRGSSSDPTVWVTGLAALYGDFGGLDMGEMATVSASEPECRTCDDGAPALSIVFEGGNDSATGGHDYLYGGDDVLEAYGGGKVVAYGLDQLVGDGEDVHADETFIGAPIDHGVVTIDVSGANDSFVGGNDVINGGCDSIWTHSGNVVIGSDWSSADGVKELTGDAVTWNAAEKVEVYGAANVDFSGGNDVFQGGNDLMFAGDIYVHTESGRVRISDGSLLVGDVRYVGGGHADAEGMAEHIYIAGDSQVASSLDFSGGNDALYGGDDVMHGSDINVSSDQYVTVELDRGFSTMYGDADVLDLDEYIQVGHANAVVDISGGNDTFIGGNDLMWAGDVNINGYGEIDFTAPRFAGYADFQDFGADWFNSHCFDELCDGNGLGFGGAYMVGDADKITTAEGIFVGANATLDFSGGNDTVIGGNDEMYGSSLNDILIGDFGVLATQEYVSGGAGSAITGDGGADTITGGNDLLDGGDGDDLLFGDWAVLGAHGANDTFTGGNDRLIGGKGCDVLVGGDGLDTMTGGGADNLGDGQSDIFVWTNLGEFGDGDIITDFEMSSNTSPGDYIDLSEVLSGFGSFNLSFANDTLSVDISGQGSFDVVSLQGLSAQGVTIDDLQNQIVTECNAAA